MQTIQLKRGALADLIALDPVPADGEMILDTDSGNFKIGDGVRGWNTLPYANISVNSLRASQIQDFSTAATFVFSTVFGTKKLQDLFDVDNSTPTTGDVLSFTSGAWFATAPTVITPNMWVAPPASASSPGIAGQIARDAQYFYICVATSTWARVALDTTW